MGTPTGWFETAFRDHPVLLILRGYDRDACVGIAERAWDLGLEWVEVPIQVPEAVASLRAVAAAARERGKQVGAGTVISGEQVRAAAESGAAFTVAPGFDPQVARASLDSGMPHLPGVATAGEIQRATTAGFRWLKVFPAAALGVDWFRAMAGPFPGVPFVATGQITAGNARDFLAAGVRVVGVGGGLADDGQLESLAALVRSGAGGR